MNASLPQYGLVCLTVGPELRFRTVTLSRYRALALAAREEKLREVYAANIATLRSAAEFCLGRSIRLYRMSSSLFPMLDLQGDDTGEAVLGALAAELRAAGEAFRAAGIRVLMHPEQFIVLNSERPEVRAASLHALSTHARVMDGLGLERSAWNLLLLHGGKGGRAAELQALIPDLPDGVRLRLGLENDERAYGPAELLEVCGQTGVPFVFDAHHHVVREGLADQEDASVRAWVLRARATWRPPAWQVVHLSNGLEGHTDRRHSYLITHLPSAYHDVPWIEVEAKGKEVAIADLHARQEGFTAGGAGSAGAGTAALPS